MRLIIPPDARTVYQWAGWTLYELPMRPGDSPLWHTFKLMRPLDTPKRWGERRSFTLTWNPLKIRLRKDRERVPLERTLPDLYARIELFLCLNYGPEWLTRERGMTVEEILAESSRLAAMAGERRARKRKSKSHRRRKA